ncbi:hypothetical protein NVP1121O_123 [Vibrio phage 1.121.O._10N.286.46.C4]|nr:hypothetical protein NVP1121O_123 [Vibrio phage 1.121.O._10N.286.46.C4]
MFKTIEYKNHLIEISRVELGLISEEETPFNIDIVEPNTDAVVRNYTDYETKLCKVISQAKKEVNQL